MSVLFIVCEYCECWCTRQVHCFNLAQGELNSTQPHLLYLSSCYGRVFTPRHSLVAASREGDQLQQTVMRVSQIMGQKGAHRWRSLIVPRANYGSKNLRSGANGTFPATRLNMKINASAQLPGYFYDSHFSLANCSDLVQYFSFLGLWN